MHRDKSSKVDKESIKESFLDSDLRKYLYDDAYDSFEGTDYTKDNLEFFNIYRFAFPGLVQVARLIFHVVASSVPSECLFSHVGLITTPLRNRLSYISLQYITYIKENMRIVYNY
jgi:hypothetical protein